ncbi:hypothetical protein AN9024.2 [Aspergillus nidulans FGSC A4]|uniref:Protein kinase domain-containing protein n=1 Tax=Emericella nidulans (strain FGSC A4 / ATCC 38163 / CBS 112.46 / NRRL 194 / M139) TaxID=227321 RepID=Q5ARQ6_EMENI|nr:hypothetical protein [Aspergillus nidulans FGSC A4]EAA64356.1 hypothetical protein AN9024.2 [Aspergillus nidulans FGSC A4]CBF84439.1 TPA: conserved hypothetical protein [Aspergillus nidulans FGSC A4]|eukprot:XP_682293.1 hypothetical protein AN9024.2 [Aspergillus nidulans FGSC A4]
MNIYATGFSRQKFILCTTRGTTEFRNHRDPLMAPFDKIKPYSELKLNSDGEISERYGFPHLGHPSQKYSLSWKTDQAGGGWLSLGNYFGFSTVFIKKREVVKPRTGFPKLQRAFHENLVGLIEAFQDGADIYLAYNYHGFAVSLSQVCSTPGIRLAESDLASICRSVLKGLEYIHETLLVAHGNVDSNNTLLCHDGAVKIANIGDSMMDVGHQRSFALDRENVGSLLVQLSIAHMTELPPRNQGSNLGAYINLSKYAEHFGFLVLDGSSRKKPRLVGFGPT